MTIQLTAPQLQALDASQPESPRLVDPRTNVAYVLLKEAEYAAIQEILEDERTQRRIRAVALRNAAGRMDDQP